MTNATKAKPQSQFVWRANTVISGLLIGVCGLFVYTGVSSYKDARSVLDTHFWFEQNLHAGFTAEVCRGQIAGARLEQYKYVLTKNRAYLEHAIPCLVNAYECLETMHGRCLAAHEPEQARDVEKIMAEFRGKLVARQEAAEQVAEKQGDVAAAGQLGAALRQDEDNHLIGEITRFKRASNLKVKERGQTFFAELQRTKTNGALLAMLVGIAVLLGIAQRLLNERRKAEETVLISEQRIRAVVDNMFDALLAIDDAGLIRAANARAADLLDYPSGTLIGMSLNDVLPSAAGCADGNNGLFEGRARKSNGALFAAEVGMRQIAAGAGMSAVSRLVTIRDITQRLEAELVRQNFIDTATENLQGPLAEIRCAISDVVSGATGEVSPKALETLRIAERNSDRLMAMLNDLLDLEKLESGSLKMQVRNASAQDITDRSLESVKALADAHKVELQSQVTVDQVMADPERMMQVLVNFLSNAIKFSPAGGVVRAIAVQENGCVEFRVTDHGRGISPEKISAVFERFKQADATDAGKGTGLGLPICKMIVEGHGGQIGATSEIGKGSMFYARIPG